MLQVYGPIYYIFELLLSILLDFSLDIIHKSPRFLVGTMQKNLEFILYNRYSGFAFKLVFILLPAEMCLILEKWYYKEDTV